MCKRELDGLWLDRLLFFPSVTQYVFICCASCLLMNMSSSVKPARYWNQLLFVVNCTLKCLELIKAHKSLPLLFVYVVCTGWHVYFLRKHKIKSPLLKLIQLSDDKIPHTQYSADVFMMKNKCFCFIHLGNKKTSPPQHQQQYVQLVSFLNSQKMVTNRWCFYVACFVRPMVPNQKTVGLLSCKMEKGRKSSHLRS